MIPMFNKFRNLTKNQWLLLASLLAIGIGLYLLQPKVTLMAPLDYKLDPTIKHLIG